MLKRLWTRLHPKHEWSIDEAALTRTCTICGKVDEFDDGCGFSGSAWLTRTKGVRAKHWTPAA